MLCNCIELSVRSHIRILPKLLWHHEKKEVRVLADMALPKIALRIIALEAPGALAVAINLSTWGILRFL
jgi:hypothetical protein